MFKSVTATVLLCAAVSLCAQTALLPPPIAPEKDVLINPLSEACPTPAKT